MISLVDVSKSFDGGATFAVRELSLEIERGETVVLLGSSGCGKSTTLKMMLRLLDPTDGELRVEGKLLTELNPINWRRSVGYVFQGIGLFPHLSVRLNVAIGLKLAGWEQEASRQRVDEMLQVVGLKPQEFGNRLPRELSGGQQQRVGVARALATDPDYLLMDEPFGALDALTRDELQRQMLDLKQRLKKTVVFVTHDIFEALSLGDRIAVLHEGRLEQVGTPQEVVGAPATEFVRDLFGKPAKQLAAFRDVLNER